MKRRGLPVPDSSRRRSSVTTQRKLRNTDRIATSASQSQSLPGRLSGLPQSQTKTSQRSPSPSAGTCSHPEGRSEKDDDVDATKIGLKNPAWRQNFANRSKRDCLVPIQPRIVSRGEPAKISSRNGRTCSIA